METITPKELHAMRESGKKVFLVDVRNPDEWSQVHATDAALYPLPDFDAMAVKKKFEEGTYDDVRIFAICRSGARSAQAAGMLESVGVDAVNVTGGTMQWEADGLPVVHGDSA